MTYSIEEKYIRFSYPGGGGYQKINEKFIDLVANPAFIKMINFLVDFRSLPKNPASR